MRHEFLLKTINLFPPHVTGRDVMQEVSMLHTWSSVEMPGNGLVQFCSHGAQQLISRGVTLCVCCLLYTSPSPRDATLSRMPSSA